MKLFAFPHFRPLTKADQALLEGAFRNNPPEISEYTFANLFAWRDSYDFRIAQCENFLVIAAVRNAEENFLPLIGKGDIVSAMKEVLCAAKGSFIRVPESAASLVRSDTFFAVQEDRDNFDYVYRISDLAEFKGRKYDGKRNFVKRFAAANVYEYRPVSDALRNACLEFEERWCSVKECEKDEGLRNERHAFEVMVKNFSLFNLIGGTIVINDSVVALAVAQELAPLTLVMHFLKADASFEGLYPTMVKEFLSRQAPQYALVNFEQDLGAAGLRKSKLSYHLSHMVKKYKVSAA